MERLAAVRGSQRKWLTAYVVWMVALATAYFAWRGVSVVALVGFSGAAAIVGGIAANRPPQRVPWLMLAGAVLIHASARVAYVELGLSAAFDQSLGRLAPIYALHLVMSVLLIGAFVGLTWPHLNARQWPALIDAAIVVLAAGLVAWLVIAQPWTANPSLPTPQVVARIAYVVRDVLLLAVVVRLITAVRWTASVGLLALGTVSLLAYDTLARIGLIHGHSLVGSPIEIGRLTFYAAVGAAALLPSMASIATPSHEPRDESGALPLVLVAISAVIPFTLLLRTSLPGDPAGPIAIAIVSAAMLALVLARLTLATVQLRRSRSEAITVRDAAADLVAASDLPSIEAAVTSALRKLLRPETAFSVRRADHRCTDAMPGQKQLTIPLDATRYAGVTSPDALVILAPPDALSSVIRPLEIIAAQIKLASARVNINEHVIGDRSEQYFRALVQNASDVIIIVDENICIRYASPSAHRMFGTSTLDGRRLPDLLAAADRQNAYELFNAKCRRSDLPTAVAVPADQDPGHSADRSIRADWRLDGTDVRWVEMSCLDLRGEDAVRGFLVTLREVTERRRLEDQLTEQAFHDPLTGLGNRSLFTAKVEAAVVDTTHPAAAVLFVDLDDFKVINDGYGHVVGDAFLKDVGHRLIALTGPTGVAARIGGDEFAVLVQGPDAAKAADNMARRVTTMFAQRTTVDGHDIMCGASVGVATTSDASSAHDLLRHADLALYEAKASGKQQWHHYDPAMTTAIMERMELQASLTEALETAALRMEYQPIVALEGGKTVGFEALIRWEHPTRGRLGPAEFIDVAEDSGLIVPIGEWVLRSAIHEATRWAQHSRQTPPYVSVNVSVKQFRTQDMLAVVQRQLEEGGLPPDRLMLEITESLLLQDDENVMGRLRRLRQLGVRIAIDDFGTGYSALSYLQRVPLDVIKLDRRFTNTMNSSKQQRHVVASIVQLAATLELEVIAEGIETMEDYGLACQTCCDYGQGYLFSRPLPPAQALSWVADALEDSDRTPHPRHPSPPGSQPTNNPRG